MKRRAEDHKKNNTTEAELKALAASGDAGAAYRLAEDKNMDQATYDNFVNKSKDESLRKAVNSKVKQNRNDLVAINRSLDPTELAKPETIANATAAGVAPAQYLADQQMGALSEEQWNDQNWTAILQPLPATATPAQIADQNRIMRSAQTAWINLKPEAKSEIRKRLSPNNAAALEPLGIG
jgi:hypothetical protein